MIESKAQFIANLQSMDVEPAPMPMPAPAARRRRIVRKTNILWRIADSRLTAAALVAMVVGAGIWTYRYREEQVLASAQALNNLVEWNLKLAERNSTLERQKLYAARAKAEQQLAMHAHLSADDQRQADSLIRDGRFLSTNEDPLAEADHFSEMAYVLITKMESIASQAPETLDHFSDTYYRVVDEGIQKNLDRAGLIGANDAATQQQIAAIDQRNARLQVKVEALIEKSPTSSQPQLQRALTLQKQKEAQRGAANKPH